MRLRQVAPQRHTAAHCLAWTPVEFIPKKSRLICCAGQAQLAPEMQRFREALASLTVKTDNIRAAANAAVAAANSGNPKGTDKQTARRVAKTVISALAAERDGARRVNLWFLLDAMLFVRLTLPRVFVGCAQINTSCLL